MIDHHSGFLRTPQGDQVRWHYHITPRHTFGNNEATMGWLGYLPPGLDHLTDPGWQILMALGWASGWLEWQGQRHAFANAPAYAEKNWGNAFPRRWFWLQANAFPSEPDLALTCGGGVRDFLGRSQTVALISLHWHNQHLCF
ncbi:MAG: tocopherol cyclase, partial [Synechococcaceae cyanobacterium SM2_3_60]|nr:tocopherol cyclase [Synechococcaceae cyanobacterium SM2_3_60]